MEMLWMDKMTISSLLDCYIIEAACWATVWLKTPNTMMCIYVCRTCTAPT